MFKFKNILLKYKIRKKFYIFEIVKQLNNFNMYLQYKTQKLAILEIVISMILLS